MKITCENETKELGKINAIFVVERVMATSIRSDNIAVEISDKLAEELIRNIKEAIKNKKQVKINLVGTLTDKSEGGLCFRTPN